MRIKVNLNHVISNDQKRKIQDSFLFLLFFCFVFEHSVLDFFSLFLTINVLYSYIHQCNLMKDLTYIKNTKNVFSHISLFFLPLSSFCLSRTAKEKRIREKEMVNQTECQLCIKNKNKKEVRETISLRNRHSSLGDCPSSIDELIEVFSFSSFSFSLPEQKK